VDCQEPSTPHIPPEPNQSLTKIRALNSFSSVVLEKELRLIIHSPSGNDSDVSLYMQPAMPTPLTAVAAAPKRFFFIKGAVMITL
jgi:hypothetical protein